MAAEHTFKLLLTELKKRKREDGTPGDVGDEAVQGKARAKANRAKSKAKAEKWAVSYRIDLVAINTYLLESSRRVLDLSWGLDGLIATHGHQILTLKIIEIEVRKDS